MISMRRLRVGLVGMLLAGATLFNGALYGGSSPRLAQEAVNVEEETSENKPKLNNPEMVAHSLAHEVGFSQFIYENGKQRICVEYDLTNPDQTVLALEFDRDNCGSQQDMFLSARQGTAQRMGKGVFGFNKGVLQPMVARYIPQRIADMDDPSQVQEAVFLFAEGGKFSLFNIFYNGGMVRKTWFNEVEKEDRKEWYKEVSTTCDSFVSAEMQPLWKTYVENARAKFEGRAKKYTFLEVSLDDELRKDIDAWVNNKPQDGRPIIEIISYPSREAMETLLERIVPSVSLRNSYQKSLENFMDWERNYYCNLRELRIKFFPEDTPIELLENQASEYDSVIMTRHINGEWYNGLTDFARNNRDKLKEKKIGVFVLGGNAYSPGLIQCTPYNAGIHSAILFDTMNAGTPAAGVFSKDRDGKMIQTHILTDTRELIDFIKN